MVEDGGQRNGEEHYEPGSATHYRYVGMAKSYG